MGMPQGFLNAAHFKFFSMSQLLQGKLQGHLQKEPLFF